MRIDHFTLGFVLIPSLVQAQSITAAADRFLTPLDAEGYLNVESADVVPPGRWDAAFWSSWQERPLQRHRDAPPAALVRRRLGASAGLTVGVAEGLAAGLQLPAVIWQRRGAGTRTTMPPIRAQGIAAPTVSLESGTRLARGLRVSARIDARPPRGTGEAHLADDEWYLSGFGAAGWRFVRRRLLVNLGVEGSLRARDTTNGEDLPPRSIRSARVLLAEHLHRSLGVPLDVMASLTLTSRRSQTRFGAAGGLRWALSDGLAIEAGIARGARRDAATLRLWTGVRLTPRGRYRSAPAARSEPTEPWGGFD